MQRRGRFITFEGIEGSGKSTLLRRVHAGLLERQFRLVVTREPGGTDLGQHLRSLLLDPARKLPATVELLLYCADRADHVATVISPALDAGIDVLCDRFSDATRAYQGFARGLDMALIDRVNVGDLEPDLTILLDLPAEVGLHRARLRNVVESLEHEARFEHERLAFHEAVRSGYLELARQHSHRFRVVSATSDPDTVYADTMVHIDSCGRIGAEEPER